MDDQRAQQRVNEAAEKFADAIKQYYQALADRSVSAQELNAQLTQQFLNGVINNLRTQAECNRALEEDLIEQQRKNHPSERSSRGAHAGASVRGRISPVPEAGSSIPLAAGAERQGVSVLC